MSGISRTRGDSDKEEKLTASSRNNHSLFSFDVQIEHKDRHSPTGSFDFLPSVSFDDLHSSIATASNDFMQSECPTPRGQAGLGVGDTRYAAAVQGTEGRTIGTGRPALSRPHRSGSFLRRQSTSTRQSSMSSTASAASSTVDAVGATLPSRSRRQSQYPPLSTTNVVGKGARKSVGPGSIDSDFATRASQRRRPSIATGASAQNVSDIGCTGRTIGSSGNAATDGARLAAARAAKTKSLQPASKQTPTFLSTPTMTPEHARSFSFGGKSPSRGTGRGTATPSSSAKRMSVMPGMPPSSSHATGLGARTVSPTDARRMKRMSMMQGANIGAPPVPNTPPAPPGEQMTVPPTSSHSPSMLPRKLSTPSSLQTTPDINRKSYSSGISVGSNTSFNTARTSTGSLQPRLPLSASTSRLPTPKLRNVHSSAGNEEEEEEEVPPVPAIPKAYESPKDSPVEQPFFNKQRKSSLPFDTSSINSTSTIDLSGSASAREPVKTDPDHVSRGATTDAEQKPSAPVVKKKNLQPLRLPPLNLLPLSTPTAAKIAALSQDSPPPSGQTTPPPRRLSTKTPSSPMTASKALFSSRDRRDERADFNLSHMRSTSSINRSTAESSAITSGNGNGRSQIIPIQAGSRQARQTVSPFLSSSLPKASAEYSLLPRSKTSGEFSAAESAGEQKLSRLTGPRAQKGSHTMKSDTPQQSSPDEPTTPLSTTTTSSSLRRKLSLGWKRTASKNSISSVSHAANERDSEYPPPPPKHDNMPPPRLPASVTLNNLSSFTSVSSPSPTLKSANYLDSKRRKSSISSLAMFSGHERTRSEIWGFTSSPKKETPNDSVSERPKTMSARASTSAVSSPFQKMLHSKPSTSTLKSQDPWTIDLDKDDMLAEEEMKKLASRRKETEQAARQLDALRKRATPKEHVSPHQALQATSLNIYERGEIIDYKDVYFCGTQTAAKHVGNLQTDAANFGYDDERGDYSIVLGDHLSYRYEIVDILGKGSFGQVVRCIDHKTGGLVAVKIIRNKKRFHQQALVEVNILQKLREWDPQNKHSMVNFTQSFYFRGHLCISTELLDMNLYEFIKSNSFRGFSLKLIRRFTKQLLSSLLLLKQHKVIHCDLKPENILLAHPMHSEIKVIDFGSSCFENEKVYTYIQSRFYRSPEVILGMTYGMPIDMWSVGCILAELYTGYPIFPGENEQEQLACIMEVFGPPEKHLIEKSTRKKLFFDSLGKPRLTVSSKGRRRKPSSKNLQQVLKCDDEAFLDFLARCLRWDPDRRLKPDEAIRHEFLTGQKSGMPMARAATTRMGSPIKRYNSIMTPSAGNRPLPEPPATSFKNGAAVRTRDVAGASPIKSAAPRRQSTVAGLNNGTGVKRTSTGTTAINSSLPRVTTRSVSAKQDLASAGASAAMGRRV
ncbi:MAG: hypothetical protein M1818_006448 [Claussenomyces sp. TS43310]|nr:MAG: hypothetical protein M1818_006448 [Claussenomyces sp. TS43310]